MTQRELAAKLGISRSYVSRIEKAALESCAPHFKNKPNQIKRRSISAFAFYYTSKILKSSVILLLRSAIECRRF